MTASVTDRPPAGLAPDGPPAGLAPDGPPAGLAAVEPSPRSPRVSGHRAGELLGRWLAEPPLEVIVESLSPAAYAVFFVSAAGLLTLAAIPGKALFGFHLVSALLALAASVPFAVGDLVLRRRAREHELVLRLWNVAGAVPFQAFFLYVAATSLPVGMAVFGAIFLFVAAYQGFMLRGGLRQPPAALVTPLATAVTYALAGAGAPIPLLAFGLVGTGSAVIVGGLALDLDRRRRENESLRAAVRAQIDVERELALSRLRESMVAASGHTHDMANLVQAAALCVASLETQLARAGAPHDDGVAETLADLRAGVEALQALSRDARAALRAERARLLEVDRVRPTAALAAALVTVGRRYPEVEFSCPAADPAVAASLRGGLTALVRILENLLANACEGDGRRGAAKVQCEVRGDSARGLVSIDIRDDGPGFTHDMLAHGVEGLTTTKAGGLGLGLYTVERQLRASGGELRLANRPEGGAAVRVLLPAAGTAPPSG